MNRLNWGLLMVDSEHRVAAPSALRARGPFHEVSDADLVEQWLDITEKVGGSLDGERDAVRNTLTELMYGVTPLSDLSGEPVSSVDPDTAAHMSALSKEIGVRIVWHNMPEHVGPVGPPEGSR